MVKHMCTDHEELYKNLLKPQMKVGNELVSQVSTKSRVNTLMESPLIMPDIQNTFHRLQNKAYQE
jgi:hypothetical protein